MLLTSPVLLALLLTPVLYLTFRLVSYFRTSRRLLRAVQQHPGPPRHWLTGHIHLFPQNPEDRPPYWQKLSALFPRSSSFYVGPLVSALQLRHPDTAKIILRSQEPKPRDFGAYKFSKPWVGHGLVISEGEKWARNRRLLTPAFHFDVLKPYMDVYNECLDIFLEKMAGWPDEGVTTDMYSHIAMYTFDVILRCAMSHVTDVQSQGEEHPYLHSISRLTDLITDRLFTPWHHPDVLYRLSANGREFQRHCDYVHSVSEQVIRERQQRLQTAPHEQRSRRYLDFLDILLKARDEDGQGLPAHEIRDEVDTFLFAGHDTTASSITWTLYSLARHPEIQKRCQQEIDGILEGRDTDVIRWDDLARLAYLTQCIKEAMRMYSPVPQAARVLTKDTEINGKMMPEGTLIDLQFYGLHHNPTVWENHNEYDPSRFDPGNIEKMDSFAFVPFSAGPRNCIGQNFAMHETKTTVARILSRFSLGVTDKEVFPHPAIVMRPSEPGMMLHIQPRV